MNLLFAGAVAGAVAYIPWTFIFLILRFAGIQQYRLTKIEECSRIQKRLGDRFSEIGDGGKGQGWAIGKWYIVYISKSSGEYVAWMITTKKIFNDLVKEVNDMIVMCPVTEKPVKKIQIIQRTGSFGHPWYRQYKLPISLKPREDQELIIECILAHQTLTNNTVAFLWGQPGTGKSMIALFLANRLNGMYCNTFSPWQPNDTLTYLYSEYEPTVETPLVIVFDEIDTNLIKIQNGIPSHKDLPIAIQDKTGWNRMLDEIQRGMFPHVILLMTSNKHPEFINSLDTSYMREGRVDLMFEVCGVVQNSEVVRGVKVD